MKLRRTIGIILLTAACVPRASWIGGDQSRRIHAEVRSSWFAQWFVLDRVEGPRFDGIGTAGIAFSSDGRHFAYPARRRHEWWLVVDGVAQGPWRGVAEPRFSTDGTHLAFLAESAAGWHAVVDGKPGPPVEGVLEGSLAFDPGGGHLAYVALAPGCSALVVDGVRGRCHGSLSIPDVSSDGRAFAVARDGAERRFLSGDAEGPAWEDIGDWTVSSDGLHSAYAALRRGKWFPVVDGQELTAAEGIRDISFGDEGRLTAWIAVSDGLPRVVVNGVTGRPWSVVSTLVASPHSSRVVSVTQDERGTWLVDGNEAHGPFTDVSEVTVSRDGKHLAAVVARPDRSVVWHDGVETPFRLLMPQTLALSSDGLHFAALVGDDRTKRIWISVDGARELPAPADEVFGEVQRPLRPWVAAQLADALAGSPAVSAVHSP